LDASLEPEVLDAQIEELERCLSADDHSVLIGSFLPKSEFQNRRDRCAKNPTIAIRATFDEEPMPFESLRAAERLFTSIAVRWLACRSARLQTAGPGLALPASKAPIPAEKTSPRLELEASSDHAA